jgi:hypothetical protein
VAELLASLLKEEEGHNSLHKGKALEGDCSLTLKLERLLLWGGDGAERSLPPRRGQPSIKCTPPKVEPEWSLVAALLGSGQGTVVENGMEEGAPAHGLPGSPAMFLDHLPHTGEHVLLAPSCCVQGLPTDGSAPNFEWTEGMQSGFLW